MNFQGRMRVHRVEVLERGVSASTQNQTKAALLFLYKEMLYQELPWLAEVVAAKASWRLPVVLTTHELRQLRLQLDRAVRLLTSLFYGTGMHIFESLRLRFKDLEQPEFL